MSSSKQGKARAFSRSSTSSPIHPAPVATRTKSHGPPRVLPLPDLPLRSSREGSRAASPTASPRLNSPRGSGDGPFLNVTAIEMVTGRSSDGVPFGERSGNHTASSPPVSSPLAGPPPFLTPSRSEGGSSRPRASTSPMQGHTRTTGFTPMIVPESRSTSTIPTSSTSGDIARTASPAKPPSGVKPQHRPIRPTPAESPPSNKALTDHLYASFLNGSCADVRLWVRKWNISWMVHKMVLVQASEPVRAFLLSKGFFRSLFLGGFSETSGAARSRKGKERARVVEDDDWTGDDVELQFDDPNITRAAFEICLSRLYSSHPTLQIPPSLLPTPQYPLTPSFPHGPDSTLSDLAASLPLRSQLATPRLLLSLLATTIYLGHASLLKEVLSMVLRTISPATAVRYLEFATDGSIGDEEWEAQDDEGARHLGGVGKEYPIRRPDLQAPCTLGEETPRGSDPPPRPTGSPLNISEEGEAKISGGSGTSHDGSPQKTAGVPSSSQRSLSRRSSHARMPHFYGTASNKIGEAVVCWLARWAIDIFNAEVRRPVGGAEWSIWGHRGIHAKFVRAALSSDQLFVRDEMERYLFARRVLELRRRGWEREFDGTEGDISLVPSLPPRSRESSRTDLREDTAALEPWDEDELELGKLFAEGIYYSHMSFDDLATIAGDIDPFTDLPYVPLNVLQSAHWAATNLRSRIQAHPSAQDHSEGDAELGLSRSVSDIYASSSRRLSASRSAILSPASQSGTSRRGFDPYETIRSSTRSPGLQHSGNQVYHPIMIDESIRLGYNGLTLAQSIIGSSSPSFTSFAHDLAQALPDHGESSSHLNPDSTISPTSSRRIDPPQTESTSFGLESGKKPLSLFSESPYTPTPKSVKSWTISEPYRFSVEFWGVNVLGDKDRLYSPVHYYAGSWWLVYLQIMRRSDKNGDPQLGIYLQRWDTTQPAPSSSAPPAGASVGGRLRESSVSTMAGGTELERGGSDDLARARGSGVGAGETFALHIRSSSVGSGSREGSIREPWRRRSDTSPSAVAMPSTETFSPSSTPSPEKPGRRTPAEPEYRDNRKIVKAYFSIICSSALGTSLVRFNSSPDVFALSQSWGWKSSALRSEEYLGLPIDSMGMGMGVSEGVEENPEGGVLGWTGHAPSTGATGGAGGGSAGRGNLRASVVLGVI